MSYLLARCWVWDGHEREAGSWEGIALAQAGDDNGEIRVIVVKTYIHSTHMSCVCELCTKYCVGSGDIIVN